jgi:hypothetical protein
VVLAIKLLNRIQKILDKNAMAQKEMQCKRPRPREEKGRNSWAWPM